MDAFGDQGIKFHTASESTVAKDSAVTNEERMRLEHSGNLVMQNKTNGLANNIKLAGGDLPDKKITEAFAKDSKKAYDRLRQHGLRPSINKKRNTPKT